MPGALWESAGRHQGLCVGVAGAEGRWNRGTSIGKVMGAGERPGPPQTLLKPLDEQQESHELSAASAGKPQGLQPRAWKYLSWN